MNPLPSKKQKFGEEEEDDESDSEPSNSDSNDFNDDDEEESENSDEDTAMESGEQIVNVDFEGVPPVDEDFDSVKKLLDQLFRGLLINTSQLADVIIQMQEFSTVLKDQNSEDHICFSVASVMNLSNPCNPVALEAATEFRSRALASYKETHEGSVADLKQFQIGGNNKESVFGLIVLEKIVNIPEDVAWQMLSTLKEDIEIEATLFSHFFMLTKRYRVGTDSYPFEDYFDTLEQFSSLKIDLDLPDNADTIQHNKETGIPFRRLLLFKAPDFYQAVESQTNG